MARYTEAVCRLCRREGSRLYLKGDRCYNDNKCAVAKRPTPPGEHGQGRRKFSEYGIQLREKQKVRRTYGLMEKQFRRYMKMAERKPGVTGETFLLLLESRLDNVVYRLGFASSRKEARQFVRHGHIEVNGRRVNIPSYLVSEGETIGVREKSRRLTRFKDLAEDSREKTCPSWMEVDYDRMEGRIIARPGREDLDMDIKESLIVEFYSR